MNNILKPFRFLFRQTRTAVWFIVTVVMAVVLLAVNLVATQNTFIYQTLCSVLGKEEMIISEDEDEGSKMYTADYESKAEALAAANELNEKVEEEGIVLLKNENSLPLASGAKVSVFGKNSVNFVYGGSGSSNSNATDRIDLYKSLSDADISYNPALKAFYEDNSRSGAGRPANPAIEASTVAGFPTGETPVGSYSSVTGSYGEYDDAAIVVISRIGGEGFDLPRTMQTSFGSDASKIEGAKSTDSHYLELDQNEEDMIKHVCENFDNVIVLLNTGTTMELGFLDSYPQIKGCLWVGFPGASGAAAIGRVLTGKVNPSGHTTDTYIKDMTKDPSWANFANNRVGGGNEYTVDGKAQDYYFVDYEEGIYVGYRYWETRGFTDGEKWYSDNVMFPMGYGLSYTDFSWKVINKPASVQTVTGEDVIKVEVEVTNEGDMAGKDVVQLYYTAPYTPGGIEKSHVVLGDFEKVEVAAHRSETVTLELKVSDMKSYDYSGANENPHKGYELEAGDYEIKICQDAHTVVDSITYNVAETEYYDEGVTEGVTVENRFDDVSSHIATYLSRNDWDGTFPAAPTATDRGVTADFISSLKYKRNDAGKPWYTDETPATDQSNGLMLADLVGKEYDDPDWEKLLDQLGYEDMLDLICIGNYQTIELMDKIGKPPTTDSDGPSGFTSFMGVGDSVPVYGTCTYAAETVLGATWNEELAYEMGKMVGNEGLIGNERGDKMPYSGWYAPAVNIHRSAFGGRNWEYYSEDGLLSGRLAAQVVKGCAEKGVYCTVKHFAANEQETNRDSNGLITWLNEQAFREIYLKPFEITVVEGQTTAIMSSFNRLGTTWAGGSYALLTGVLRDEWGFDGMVITDYALQSYMNADQMIRAGGDLSLAQGARMVDIDRQGADATTLAAMRNATKNVLYTVANSNAMNLNIQGKRAPVWVRIMIGVDVGIVVALAGWGVWAIVSAKKKQANVREPEGE